MREEKSRVKNVADPKQVKEGKQYDKLDRKQELQDLKDIMMTPQGRRVIFRIINNLCHYDSDDAVNSGSWTYFNSGQRSIGRALKNDVFLAAFEEWQQMEKEHVEAHLEEVDGRVARTA